MEKKILKLRPRISEKASFLKTGNCYVFEIPIDMNKRMVTEAIRNEYKKTPVQVRVVPIPKKQVFMRGKWGTKVGGKKAYVFLKQGDTIEV